MHVAENAFEILLRRQILETGASESVIDSYGKSSEDLWGMVSNDVSTVPASQASTGTSKEWTALLQS